MPGAALAYLPLPASPRPAPSRPSTRRINTSPFSRQPREHQKPRQGVKYRAPRYAPGLTLKTHANPPGITPVAEEAVVGCCVAAKSEAVIFNNGWRTLDGKFASPLGAGRAGGSAEVGVWDAIAAKPGWSVRTGNVAVRDASGQLRYYDGIAISPRDRIIGLEVKSGDASRTAAQRLFDTTLNSSPSNVATGVGQSAGTTVRRSILIRPGQ